MTFVVGPVTFDAEELSLPGQPSPRHRKGAPIAHASARSVRPGKCTAVAGRFAEDSFHRYRTFAFVDRRHRSVGCSLYRTWRSAGALRIRSVVKTVHCNASAIACSAGERIFRGPRPAVKQECPQAARATWARSTRAPTIPRLFHRFARSSRSAAPICWLVFFLRRNNFQNSCRMVTV